MFPAPHKTQTRSTIPLLISALRCSQPLQESEPASSTPLSRATFRKFKDPVGRLHNCVYALRSATFCRPNFGRYPQHPAALRSRGRNFARPRSKTCWSLNSIALGSEEIIVASLLGGCITIGQRLATQTNWGKRLTSPLVIMLLAMALSASGLLPPESGVYALVWDRVMPLGVALSLLGTDLRHLVRDAGVTLMAFAYGALGTVLGTVVGWAVTGPGLLGPEGWKVAAALCASYIGGSVNFASTAKALGLGATAAGESLIPSAMAADNLAMGIFLLALIAVSKGAPEGDVPSTQSISQPPDQTCSAESLPSPTIRSIGISLLVASLVCALAEATATACGIPSAALGLVGLMASSAAMITEEVRARWSQNQSAEQTRGTAPVVHIPVFTGADSLGTWAMMCFFSSVGAKANLWEAVSCGGPLLLFISILLMVHLVVAVVLGKLSGLPIRAIVIASNANVGGPATAAAMATSQRWPDMVQPALVTGTFGYSIGTVVACIVAKLCLAP